MRQFSEGFEGGDLLRWNSIVTGFTASTAIKRSGAYSAGANAGGNPRIDYTMGVSVSEFYFRSGVRVTQYPSGNTDIIVFGLNANFSNGGITLNGDGSISYRAKGFGGDTVLVTTAPAILPINNWCILELYLKLDTTVGVATLRVDAVQRGTFNGNTRQGQGDSTINKISLIAPPFNQINFDDVGLNDTTGTVDNSWLGDGHIIALAPNATGTVTQFLVTGSAVNYLAVSEIPPNNDTSYVYTSATGTRDFYNLANTGLSNVVLGRVWVEFVGKLSAADASSVGAALRISGTNFDDVLQPLTTVYARYKTPEWTLNPYTSGVWTVADVDGLQAGLKT